MSYTRVLPRDFFNESKLLKCLGALCLLKIHNMEFDQSWMNEVQGNGFYIELSEVHEGLYVANIEVRYMEKEIFFYSPYNSKSNYPLLFLKNEEGAFRVFTEDGKLSHEFSRFLLEIEKEEVTKP